jgi:hypothetical protein
MYGIGYIPHGHGHGGHGGHGGGGHHGGGWQHGAGFNYDYPVDVVSEVVSVPSQTCPSLYVWDAASQACKLDFFSPPLLIAGAALLLVLFNSGRR